MLAVQSAAFDPGQVLNEFTAKVGNSGAVVSFTGLVRDDTGDLKHMQIEHYPGMTEKAIGAMMDKAQARWNLTECTVIHRYGELAPNEVIMMVATAASHRVEAFEAADYLMDYLKSCAPFWKKEVSHSGDIWVASKQADEEALNRW
ncbi:MAG: molybdenum cofactor biosynthesis protein MoaE [Rhodobacteraceae bacterium]|nr:molybdenum cofactor biosynthesis protein MoaE [Paracoccaceae bacterium]